MTPLAIGRFNAGFRPGRSGRNSAPPFNWPAGFSLLVELARAARKQDHGNPFIAWVLDRRRSAPSVRIDRRTVPFHFCYFTF